MGLGTIVIHAIQHLRKKDLKIKIVLLKAKIIFDKPGSVNPLEGWGLPLGVSYPRHASSRPGRSTEILWQLCNSQNGLGVSVDFLQLWSNNNRLIISSALCVWQDMMYILLLLFKLFPILLTVVWITIGTDQLSEADRDLQNYNF